MHNTQSIHSYQMTSRNKSKIVNMNEDKENVSFEGGFFLLSPKDLQESNHDTPRLPKKTKLYHRPQKMNSNDFFEASCDYLSTSPNQITSKETTEPHNRFFLQSPNGIWSDCDSMTDHTSSLPRSSFGDSLDNSTSLVRNNIYFEDSEDASDVRHINSNISECQSLICKTPKRILLSQNTSPPPLKMRKFKHACLSLL